ncbi:MAG: Uma2 family endonuclease [Thermomicrobiales bacterium]
MATTTQLLTYDDLCRMPDDGNRYELIGGELVVSPAPTWLHQEVLVRLGEVVRPFVAAGNHGRVGIAPLDVHLGRHDIVQPDMIFVSRERVHVLTSNGTEGPPDLVVEILSPTTRRRDLGAKLVLYASAGVREYWAVEVADPDFMLFVLKDGELVRVPHDGKTVRSVVLPGLEIDRTSLFANLGMYRIGNR